jgi:hypothetical protein
MCYISIKKLELCGSHIPRAHITQSVDLQTLRWKYRNSENFVCMAKNSGNATCVA